MNVRGLFYRIGVILVLLEIGLRLDATGSTAFKVGILLMTLAAMYPVFRFYVEGAAVVFGRPLWRFVTRLRGDGA